jgi:phosphatidylserine/phosphatidylglycerophosphate/cardiolipin synthase-like enzyme
MGVILYDDGFLPAAISIIAHAEKSIFISSFKIEISEKPKGRHLKQFFEILSKKAQEKVDIRVLTNKQNEQGYVPHTNGHAIRHFKQKHIPTRYLPNGRISHAKIIIVDNQKAILGSHNLSVRSCRSNFELSCLITDILTIDYLSKLYTHVWNTGKDAF